MSRPFYSDGKKAKMCRSSASSSSLSHFFPRDFSGTIADSDIINTPLKPFYQQMCLLGVSLTLLSRKAHGFFVINFYRAMLCIRGTSHGPVSVCVCVCVCLFRLSQAGVLLKRQNIGSHKQHHTIPHGL